MLMGIFMMENGKTTGGKEKECILVQQPNSRYVVMKVDSFTTKEWVWLMEVNPLQVNPPDISMSVLPGVLFTFLVVVTWRIFILIKGSLSRQLIHLFS